MNPNQGNGAGQRRVSVSDMLKRWLDAWPVSAVSGQSWRKLHSPTLFEWGRALQSNPKHWPQAVVEARGLAGLEPVNAWHQSLLANHQQIARLDLGAGSRRTGARKSHVRISDLARTSLTPHAHVHALCRWLMTVSPEGRFLELGTSLGTTSACVAAAGWQVETWEGCQQTLSVAQQGWEMLGLTSRIASKCGDFRELIQRLEETDGWDVVYVDGLHLEEATSQLVDALAQRTKVGMIVDDVAWSSGMHRAWRSLQQREEWRVSFSWRGRGFLVKAPHMERQAFRLA